MVHQKKKETVKSSSFLLCLHLLVQLDLLDMLIALECGDGALGEADTGKEERSC